MRPMTGEDWTVTAQLYAFLGNSLLMPMSRTESVGLDPMFWRDLCGLCDGALAAPAEALASWAECAAADAERSELVRRVSVEFTKLFVGPPKPAAAPWESANGAVASHVGFGVAAFAMRERLRALGLQLCNENNQYEDHLGIELLYLSELCRRMGDVEAGQGYGECGGVPVANGHGAVDDDEHGAVGGVAGASHPGGSSHVLEVPSPDHIAAFVREHPLEWIGCFREKVAASQPGGYYVRLLDFAIALLEWQVR